MSQRTHQLEGREEEERVCELGNVVRHKRGLADWGGGKGRGGLVSWKHGTSQTRTHSLEGGEAGW